jgi:hypothetical protein
MNEKIIEDIEKIIRDDVCGMCPAKRDSVMCLENRERCYAAYHRQAVKIAENVVKLYGPV